MNSEQSHLEKYRVPKKKNKEPIELLPQESEQRNFLISKIRDTFRKPEISKESMKFHRIYSINLTSAENAFSKKRLMLKGKNMNVSESFGFLYLKSEYELKKTVELGKIAIGNFTESCVANPSMGVSLSQHADIYHPDCPKSGYLLVVKYMKGRIHYVPFDTSPMDPQPNFDCHIIRKPLSNNDSSISCYNAFHSTQVFTYEYSEDVDIQKYPSQLLIIGAAQFSWHGNYLYKISVNKEPNGVNSTKVATKRPSASSTDSPAPKKVLISIPSTNAPPKYVSPVTMSAGREVMTSTLIIGNVLNSASSLKVKLLSRLKDPIMISNLMSQAWNLVELLPCWIFEEYLSNKTHDNHFGKHLTLSSTTINVFPHNFNFKKKLGGFFRPKFAMHFTMIPECFRDHRVMSKIISNLEKSNAVGVVRCNPLSNILFYVLPSGKTSKNLGLFEHDAPNILHVILFTEQHPEFLQCSYSLMDKRDKREQKVFEEIMQHYESSVPAALKIPLISMSVLKNSVSLHNKLQRDYFEKWLKLSSTTSESNSNQQNQDSDMDVDSNSDSCELARSINDARGATIINQSPLCTVETVSKADVDYRIPPPVGDSLSQSSNQLQRDSSQSILTCIPKVPLIPSPKNGCIPIIDSSKPPIPQVIESNIISISDQPASIPNIPLAPIEYFGEFKLIKVQFLSQLSRAQRESRSDQIKLKRQCTARRPTHLDSDIFETMIDNPHIRVYKG